MKKERHEKLEKKVQKEKSRFQRFQSFMKPSFKKVTFLLLAVLLITFIFFKQEPRFHFDDFLKKTFSEKKLISNNYVFLGDSITAGYPLEDYYEGLFVVNSGIGGYTTDDILDNLDRMVYRYNPSKIFLLIGTNDHNQGKDPKVIVDNIEKIIDKIHKKRPYSKIYVESIYPINDKDFDKTGRNNDTINDMNKLIQKLCKKKSITYIDVHSHLLDKDKKLKKKYTYDGLHLNELGYVKVTNVILPYLEEDSQS